ncbi:MAG TPA: hypothetical protein ENN33_15535 [Ignavibacteria bacterium]|nr:hypothetical protein [Ignavibacteria bacterium]
MERNHEIIALFILAIFWGISEILLGDLIRSYPLPVRGMFLTSLAVVFIICTKELADFTGSVILLAVIAVILKAVYYGTIQHSALLAVLIQGVLAEVIFYLVKDFKKASISTAVILMLYTFGHGIIMHGFFWGTHIFTTYKNMFRDVFLLNTLSKLPLEMILIVFGILNIIVGFLLGILTVYLSKKLKKLLNLFI